jgi:hypothetical protein
MPNVWKKFLLFFYASSAQSDEEIYRKILYCARLDIPKGRDWQNSTIRVYCNRQMTVISRQVYNDMNLNELPIKMNVSRGTPQLHDITPM